MKTISSSIYLTFAAVLLTFLEILPEVQAVVPAPDGGYPAGNTAEGQNALLNLTNGAYNTAIGYFSLRSATTGSFNTAVGAGALFSNTGNENTAVGIGALFSSSADFNTAVGSFALSTNSFGLNNTAVGWHALQQNTSSGNTAVGEAALIANTTAALNTALGVAAASNNTIGGRNTAIGKYALEVNTTGSSNTVLGSDAGSSLTTGDNNIDIGAGVTGSAGESNTIRIGDNLSNTAGVSKCYIGGIANQTAPFGSSVIINPSGQLGTVQSSKRFKQDIKPMDKTSEAVLALRPVTFHYKTDNTNTAQFGLVAEEVAEVDPDLVVRDNNGEIWTVRYEAVNAMLLNEFLKEHRTVQEQGQELQKQAVTIARQQKQIETLAMGLQKISAQLEVTKSAPQTVLNDHNHKR